MAGGTAFFEFKDRYYDKISDQAIKEVVDKALLNILASAKYNLMTKAKTSYVCADIQLESAMGLIESLTLKAEKMSAEGHLLSRSIGALREGKSISDITYDDLRRRGEL